MGPISYEGNWKVTGDIDLRNKRVPWAEKTANMDHVGGLFTKKGKWGDKENMRGSGYQGPLIKKIEMQQNLFWRS